MQSLLNEPDSTAWNQIAPLLDQALNCLGEKEHDAVVLRFFEGKELNQVGTAMGTTEDAARMRVNRGVEKLREFFTKKGVTLPAKAIIGAFAASSAQAAPAGLAAAVTAAALSGTAITTAAVIAATETTAMTILQKTVLTATAAILARIGIYEARQISSLRAENAALGKQTEQLAELGQLRADKQRLVEQLRAERARAQTEHDELLRNRGRAAALRQIEQENARLKTERGALAKQIEDQSAKLPEQDPGFQLRRDKMTCLSNWGLGLKQYARVNNGLPANLAEAAPFISNSEFFLSNLGAIIQNDLFEMVGQGPLTNLGDPARIIIVREREPVRVSNGSWARAYLFGDGHAEIHMARDGDFTTWEQEHLPPLPHP